MSDLDDLREKIALAIEAVIDGVAAIRYVIEEKR